MKTQMILITILFMIVGCESFEENDPAERLIGTWVESNPETTFDDVTDTLIFNADGKVSRHFFYDSWNYELKDDSITFTSGEKARTYKISFDSMNEIVLYNFLDRTITQVVKDIHFTKINSENEK